MSDYIYNTDDITNTILYWARNIFVIENNICKKDDKETDFNFDLMSIKEDNKIKLYKILDWIVLAFQFIKSNKEKIKNYYNENILDYILFEEPENYELDIKDKILFSSLLYLCQNKNGIISSSDLEKIVLFRDLIFNANIEYTSKNIINTLSALKEIIKLNDINNFNSIGFI
ncbi:hypothetical protein R4J03_12550 [Brachyspira intermedia]|uniref:hypothetical protein n=1 Tax=Brachyspira intermedia TaxID=84377 RepID=UPI00261774BE|nr:hypothetical protein [uncultured Brachyspira sp.]